MIFSSTSAATIEASTKMRQFAQNSSCAQTCSQRRPLPRMEVRRPIGCDGERGHHHRDDAGDVQVAVGDDEAESR